MSKKKRKHKPKKGTTNEKQTALHRKKKSSFLLFAFIAGGAFVAIGANLQYQGEKQLTQTTELSELKKENANLRENRPTLSPQRFSGTFRLAYEAARKIPEVLDRLYCYCRCQENLGHKNLLSCYVDTHAST